MFQGNPMMLERMNFTEKDYGRTMKVSVWGFPGAVLIKSTEHKTPSSEFVFSLPTVSLMTYNIHLRQFC